MATRPALTTEISFTTAPLAAVPVWVDISNYVLELSFGYGRKYELDRFEAGTLTMRLDNMDRRFDPTNTASPYYPNVLPTKKIRISATYNALTYILFVGFIEDWPPDWTNPHDDEMTVNATDGFLYLANATYTGTLPGEFSGSAVNTFLTALGWPLTDRNVNTGLTFIDPVTPAETIPGLAHLQDIAAAENGSIYIAGSGEVTYEGRHYRLLNSQTSQGSFGFGGSDIPYTKIQPVFDDALIRNDIHVSAEGGTEQIASDATSQTAYFKRTLNKTGLIIGDGSGVGGNTPDNEAAGLATWLLYNLKDPAVRFASLQVEGGAGDQNYADTVWPFQLSMKISYRITVNYTPPTGATITKDCYIERVQHTITDKQWITDWQLSPASDANQWWIMNTSALDVTTRLAH